MKKFSQAIARTLGSARAKVALAAAPLLVAAGSANATPLGTFLANLKTDGGLAVGAAIIVFAIVGVVGIGYGGLNMKKKGGDRGDDITAMKIIAPIVGGSICLCIALICGIVASEMGGSSSSMGQQIQVGQ